MMAADIEVDRSRIFFSDVIQSADGGSSIVQRVRIINSGTTNVTLGANPIGFTGTNASEFTIQNSSGFGSTLTPGQSASADLVFRAGSIGIRTAILTASTTGGQSDTSTLRGLGTAGNGGNNEPSLQRILDLFQLNVNVGDNTPNNTDITTPPNTPNDEVVAPRFRPVGSGAMTVEVLANFAASTSPSTRFGVYEAGTLQNRQQLFTIGQQFAQTISPVVSGTTSFSRQGDFGLYAEYPDFGNRIATSEDTFNTWEPNSNNQRKIRFYEVPGEANSYIFATEDWDQAYDSNDIVGIIRNVQISPSGPELGYENLDGAPFADRLVFNRIRELDLDLPNEVHDTSTLRVINTGTSALNVTNVSISNGDFQINSGGGSFSLSPGQTRNIVVQFVYNRSGLGNEIRAADLTLINNDSNEGSKVIRLAGLWQSFSEDAPGNGTQEPTAQTIINTFGYDIDTGDVSANQGNVVKDGEEVLSPFFLRADAGRDVTVRQIAAFHQQGINTAATLRYYTPDQLTGGDLQNFNRLFRHRAEQGQSFFPALDNNQNNPAQATFNPGNINQQFGFRIDSHWSDPQRMQNENFGSDNQPDGGQAVRAFAAKDLNGNIIPDTYIILQDYTGLTFSNYDYQDNIYIISNVKPASAPTSPASTSATNQSGGILVNWADNTEGNLAGYRVQRATSNSGPFVDVRSDLLQSSQFTDTAVAGGQQYFYRVFSVDYHGTSSSFASTSITRTADSTAPSQPAGLSITAGSGGILLNWTDNSENDLSGYNVYRSTSSNGSFSILNSGLLSSSAFEDTTAPQGVVSFYRVSAVDFTGNESGFATTSATRPVSNIPAAPTGVAVTFSSGARIVWNDASSTETSFQIERQTVGQVNWSRLINSRANSELYTDRSAAAGASYTYRIRASSAAGNSAWIRSNFTVPGSDSFTSRTIGNPTPAGSSTVVTSNRAYNVSSGGDVAGTSDSFRFISRSYTGNFDVKVTVQSITGPRDTSFAGLMIRSGTDTNSANLFIRNTKSAGLRVTERLATGGSTSTPAGLDSATFTAFRLRLRRVGSTLTASYWNTDINNWSIMRTTTANFGSTVQVGMAVAARATNSAAAAQFRDLTTS